MDSHRAQLVLHDKHRIDRTVLERDVAVGDRRGEHERSGLDAVGHHGVINARELLDPFDHQTRRTVPLDAGAHSDQHAREIDDFGFARGRLDNRRSLRQSGGTKNVGGA